MLILACIGYAAHAQPGFNEAYDLGALAAAFASMELSGDTLVVYGVAKEEGQTAFGMLFARFDTSGNILDARIDYDSMGKHFTVVSPNGFIKLSNGSGYAGVGQFFNPQNGYFARFDNSGELVNFVEYYEDSYTNHISRAIIETNDGYLICGTEYSPSTDMEVFIQRIDMDGNIKWKRRYGTNNKLDLFGGILKLNDDEYVVGGSTITIPVVTPLPQTKYTSKIFTIDSLGNIKWQWESQPSLNEMGVGNIHKSEGNNWVYKSARGWYNSTYNEISVQPKFIIRDEDFNLIREDTFGVADYPVNGFAKLIQLNDGGWLLIGVKPVHYPIPPVPMWYNSFSGWMVRLDSQGDQLWSRVDTAFWSYETGSTNYYYDAVELPSGSLVVCGYSRTYEPVPKDWGWLIKVSKDGCLDTLFCSPVSASFPVMPDKAVTLYPNPASSWVNIQSEGIDKWDRIEVFNVHGQLMHAMRNTTESRIDISRLDDGVYFVRLTKAGQSVTKKVIKRR